MSSADELLQSIATSLDLLVKLKVKEFQGDRKIKEMILLLDSLGCRPVEIAAALGKTPNDVNPVLSKERSSKAGGNNTKKRKKTR